MNPKNLFSDVMNRSVRLLIVRSHQKSLKKNLKFRAKSLMIFVVFVLKVMKNGLKKFSRLKKLLLKRKKKKWRRNLFKRVMHVVTFSAFISDDRSGQNLILILNHILLKMILLLKPNLFLLFRRRLVLFVTVVFLLLGLRLPLVTCVRARARFRLIRRLILPLLTLTWRRFSLLRVKSRLIMILLLRVKRVRLNVFFRRNLLILLVVVPLLRRLKMMTFRFMLFPFRLGTIRRRVFLVAGRRVLLLMMIILLLRDESFKVFRVPVLVNTSNQLVVLWRNWVMMRRRLLWWWVTVNDHLQKIPVLLDGVILVFNFLSLVLKLISQRFRHLFLSIVFLFRPLIVTVRSLLLLLLRFVQVVLENVFVQLNLIRMKFRPGPCRRRSPITWNLFSKRSSRDSSASKGRTLYKIVVPRCSHGTVQDSTIFE